MAQLKTAQTAASVEKFLAAIPDDTRRADARAVCKLIGRVARAKPAIWGSSIVGFGRRTLVYPSGRSLDWMVVGFSPRKANTVLYLHLGSGGSEELLARLGKHTTGKGCLYVKRLGDIDVKVLEELVRRSVRHAKASS